MTTLAEQAVGSFRDRLEGRLVTPDDTDYDQVRSIWNGAIDHRPALVARCASLEDLATALGFAREEHLEISVRGGGHSFSGASICPDGLVVDLSDMNGVEVDPDARTVRCGGPPSPNWTPQPRCTASLSRAARSATPVSPA
ncbi:FAD-dependent oxidoreductase [Streptomyces sp. CB03238]|uniref:FAD-binding oxidoreductase n=1 Tax=Streptomyces sp. CB03238 TaxID=1907777 RepID=UPI0019D4A289|nr:FAD-dependent oxidoreductase [Streptomyces sp. CB03238]